MPTPQKETPASGDNHPAGVNTQITVHIIDQHQARRYASLKARAARLGYELEHGQTGYMLVRGSHSKHSADLNTLQALLQRMGA